MKDVETLKKALENIELVIKSGEIIKNQEKFNMGGFGKIFWASGKAEKDDSKLVLTKKKEFYQKYYSIFYDSYDITIDNNILRKIV